MLRDRPLAGALFVGSFAVFLLAPTRQYADSYYALLVSEGFLRTGSPKLNQYLPPTPPPLDRRRFPGIRHRDRVSEWTAHGYPYQLERGRRGALYYRYSPGTSFLSLPFVAALNVAGLSAVGDDGLYDRYGDERMQALLAALVSAGIVVLLYGIARLRLPPASAVGVSLLAAFASQVLSTTSRGLWSHTWGTLLLAWAILLVARSELEDGPPPGPLAASLLSLAVFARSADAIHAMAIGLFVVVRHRRAAWRFAATAAAWIALGVAWSESTRGVPVPDYYTGARLTAARLLDALAGHLVSPSRGLLVFCPAVVPLAWMAGRYVRSRPAVRLTALAAAAVLAHLLMVSMVRTWWGGHSYGPRLLTELVPWCVLVATLALSAARDRRRREGRPPPGFRIEVTVLAVLLGWGLFVHGRGSTVRATWGWNTRPVPVGEERVWSWSDPQFLAEPRPRR